MILAVSDNEHNLTTTRAYRLLLHIHSTFPEETVISLSPNTTTPYSNLLRNVQPRVSYITPAIVKGGNADGGEKKHLPMRPLS